MSVVSLLVVLIVVGVLLYLINTVVPMVPWMKTVINAVVGLFVLIWVLQSFGLIGGTLHLR